MKSSQCAFVQFTQRSAAESAAEGTFNKLIIKDRKLNIKWGKNQAQQGQKELASNVTAEPKTKPVPGLPGGMIVKINYYINACDLMVKNKQ